MDKVINEARDFSSFGHLDEEDVKPLASMPVNNRKDDSADHDPRALVTHLCQERRDETGSVEPTANPRERLYYKK